MKKLISILLTLLFLFSLTSCGGEREGKGDEEDLSDWEYVAIFEKKDKMEFFEEVKEKVNEIDDLYPDFKAEFYEKMINFYNNNYENEDYAEKEIFWNDRDVLIASVDETEARVCISSVETE